MIAIGSLSVISMMAAVSSADPIVVSPANMGGWTLNSFDDFGSIVTSGPFAGTAEMTTGPATPPLGVGSAHLATPAPSAAPDPSNPGSGGAAAIATEGFDNTPLSALTALSYHAYMANNGPVNNQQFPYLALSINTGNVDNSGDSGADANMIDTLFFEPPYQQPSTGNASLPDQGATVLNQWQSWNALEGGFWDNLGIGNPGTGVMPLSTFVADFPNATIQNGGLPGLGGVALQVGFADSTSQFDGYVDDFTIGINGANATYDFEPSVPEPASMGMICVGGAAVLMRRRKRAVA
jgi:hypothetical protein